MDSVLIWSKISSVHVFINLCIRGKSVLGCFVSACVFLWIAINVGKCILVYVCSLDNLVNYSLSSLFLFA